ncbi:hypothetical protein MCHI_000400 [Candidatus Magnetoovum chiemensis]|nr:hypothetical protein MCHI_000400 [Candidatus Magnetoovum chiemensis]
MKRKKVFFNFMLLVSIIAGLSATAIAQPLEKGTAGRDKEKVETMREKISTIKMWKLTQALDLDESTASRLFPLLNSFDKKRAPLEVSLRENIATLKKIIETASDDELAKSIDDIRNTNSTLNSLNEEDIAAIKDILPLRQQAKYLLFQMDFNREMRMTMDKLKDARLDRHRQSKNAKTFTNKDLIEEDQSGELNTSKTPDTDTTTPPADDTTKTTAAEKP